MISGWSFAISAVVATSIGHVVFKLGVQNSRNIFIISAVACFVGSMALTFLALRTLDVGSVFMLTALTPLLSSFGAFAIGSERPPPARWLAIGLCVIGILLYQLG